MKSDALNDLEYPRHMHGPNQTFRRVENVEEAQEAQKDGFSVQPELDDTQKKAVAAAEKKAGPGNRSRQDVDEDEHARSSVSQPIKPHEGNRFSPDKK